FKEASTPVPCAPRGTSVRAERCRLSKRSRIMRASIAFFAGAGTVAAAIALGLGGGLVMGNIMNPREAKPDMSKIDRSAAPLQVPQPSPPSTSASNMPRAPAPYLAQTEAAAKAPVVVVRSPNPSPSNETATSPLPAAQPATTSKQTAAAAEPAKPAE